MHSIFHPLVAFISQYSWAAYAALFIGVFWEGEVTLIMAGIFVHLGAFSLPITIAVAVLAAIAKMLTGYALGRFIGKRFPHSTLLKYFERRVLFFLPRFRENPFWSIVVSKCIYGVNNATLVFAGYVGADRKTYLKAETLSSVVWLGGMFGLGFFFSQTALAFTHNIKSFSFLIILFILGFVILLKVINLIIEVVEEWGVDKKAAHTELEK